MELLITQLSSEQREKNIEGLTKNESLISLERSISKILQEIIEREKGSMEGESKIESTFVRVVALCGLISPFEALKFMDGESRR